MILDLSVLFWIATGLGLIGTVLNALHYRYCFYLWLFSNSVLAYQAYSIGAMNLALMYGFYFLLGFVGLWQWGRHEKQNEERMVK